MELMIIAILPLAIIFILACASIYVFAKGAKQKAECLKSRVTSLKKELSEKEAQIVSLEEELSEKEAQIASLKEFEITELVDECSKTLLLSQLLGRERSPILDMAKEGKTPRDDATMCHAIVTALAENGWTEKH